MRSRSISRTRAGVTLVELLLALAIAAALLGLALPPSRRALDRSAVRGASRDAETLFATAREEALARDATVWVAIDSASGTIRMRISGGGTRSRAVGSLYGVTLRSTRDSMRYDGRGLGRGGANLTLVIGRGSARDTLVISRLGRVRR